MEQHRVEHPEPQTLRDQVGLVVGGAQGIGRAIAEALAAAGAAVALWDIDQVVDETALAIAATHHGATRAERVDVTDGEAVAAAAERILAWRGGPSHIVFAAGAGSGKYGFPFWSLSPDDWPRVLDVNLQGAVRVAHAFAPQLTTRRQGTLLFIASIAGQIGSQTDPPYSAAKAGLINFAQCAAKDLAAFGVRVNTICPGMIKSQLNQSVWRAWRERQAESEKLSYEAWARQKIDAVTPLGRWQEPRDVAALAVFLMSDQAKNITGQTMNVDGGQVMHS